jgi:hypothetical protein
MQGWFESRRQRNPIDAAGRPLPWYTYPAIEYLSQIDWSEARVFEYGSGNSSLYWAGRAKLVWSVEHDSRWHEHLTGKLASNHNLVLCSEEKKYASQISSAGVQFDVVVVDGIRRFECVQAALAVVADSGLIVLDNSDWFPRSCDLLRRNDFIQIDFTGAGPINPYAWTTSIFLKRAFQWVPAMGRQPCNGVGALIQFEDE